MGGGLIGWAEETDCRSRVFGNVFVFLLRRELHSVEEVWMEKLLALYDFAESFGFEQRG